MWRYYIEIDEMYGAEAKCQVYGSIHSLMHSNPHETSDVSKSVSDIFLCPHEHIAGGGYFKGCILNCLKMFYFYLAPVYLCIGFLVYDDGCHLLRFATNPKRCGLTETAKKIASTKIVVDKMHFKGHKDQWCRRHCNPNDYDALMEVGAGVCGCVCL